VKSISCFFFLTIGSAKESPKSSKLP
jgi:hypothetical protein